MGGWGGGQRHVPITEAILKISHRLRRIIQGVDPVVWLLTYFPLSHLGLNCHMGDGEQKEGGRGIDQNVHNSSDLELVLEM